MAPGHTSPVKRGGAVSVRPWVMQSWVMQREVAASLAPDRNAIKATWRDLKRYALAYRTLRAAADFRRITHQARVEVSRKRCRTSVYKLQEFSKGQMVVLSYGLKATCCNDFPGAPMVGQLPVHGFQPLLQHLAQQVHASSQYFK